LIVPVLALALVALAMQPANALIPAQATATRLGFCGGDDWEPDVAADAAGHVYAVWAHFAGAGGCRGSNTGDGNRAFIQTSGNGGKTWGAPHLVADTVNGVNYPNQVDTTVTVSDTGVLYVGFLAYGLHGSELDTIVARSTDFGKSFSVVRKVNGPACPSTDHPFGVAQGNDVYFTYTDGKTHCISVSTDAGNTWTEAQVGTFGAVGFSEGGVVDATGNAWFSWGDCETSNCTGAPAGDYRVSRTLAGTTSTTFSPVLATGPQGPDCPYSSCGFAYFGNQDDIGIDGGGNLYLAYQDGQVHTQRKSPPIVNLLRCQAGSNCVSADGWTSMGRVDDKNSSACAGSACYALFPRVAGGSVSGSVTVMWMDDRNDSLDGVTDHVDGWNVWYRTSSTGGTSWTGPGVKLSSFDPSQMQSRPNGFLFPYGDYEDLTGLNCRGGGSGFVWGEGINWNGGASNPGHIEFASTC